MNSTANCVLVAFLVIGILIALYFAYTKFMVKEKFTDNAVRVCLFYATWCPHCEKYLESGVFDKAYSNTKSANSNVVFEKIDYEQNKNMAAKYGVNSFPTIIAVDTNGKKISTFKGDRYDADLLERFAMEAVAKS